MMRRLAASDENTMAVCSAHKSVAAKGDEDWRSFWAALKAIFRAASRAALRTAAYWSLWFSIRHRLFFICDGLDFNQRAPGQVRHGKGRAGRAIRNEIFAVHLVHRREVGNVFEVNRRFDHIGKPESGLPENRADVFQRLPGLAGDVLAGKRPCGGGRSEAVPKYTGCRPRELPGNRGRWRRALRMLR